MSKLDPLEVTITHNIGNAKETAKLFDRRLIALDWDRKGPNPDAYTHRRARQDVKLFNKMRETGAAVIAAYKGATDKRSDRLVGWVAPGTRFKRLNGLLCLPLSRARLVDSSARFFGNLAPHQCTVQTCHRRAEGKLIRFVLRQKAIRGVTSIHNRDVECLVTNFLFVQGICATVWTGGRSFEDIDHAGYALSGREVLAQTTMSKTLVGQKARRLLQLKKDYRDLLMFGPESARDQCPSGVEYHSIEDVFSTLDNTPPGQRLIDRM